MVLSKENLDKKTAAVILSLFNFLKQICLSQHVIHGEINSFEHSWTKNREEGNSKIVWESIDVDIGGTGLLKK